MCRSDHALTGPSRFEAPKRQECVPEDSPTPRGGQRSVVLCQQVPVSLEHALRRGSSHLGVLAISPSLWPIRGTATKAHGNETEQRQQIVPWEPRRLVVSADHDGPAPAIPELTADGRLIFPEFHLVMPCSTTVAATHQICRLIEDALKAGMAHLMITIHAEPDDKARQGGIPVL